jgi:hypothetical protein
MSGRNGKLASSPADRVMRSAELFPSSKRADAPHRIEARPLAFVPPRTIFAPGPKTMRVSPWRSALIL